MRHDVLVYLRQLLGINRFFLTFHFFFHLNEFIHRNIFFLSKFRGLKMSTIQDRSEWDGMCFCCYEMTLYRHDSIVSVLLVLKQMYAFFTQSQMFQFK